MTLFYSLSPVDLIRCVGPDAARFLHGQLSQNIEALAVGDSADSLLLMPDGHLLTTVRVERVGDDEFRLLLPQGTDEIAVSQLSRFLLRTDCVLETIDGWQAATVIGAGAATLRQDFPDDVPLISELGWPGVDGALVLWPFEGDMPGSLVNAVLDPAAVDAARIAAGVAAFGHELAAGQIANEAGPRFVERHVDFTKGCYVGQELVARVHHRGSNTPQRVVRLVGDDAAGSPSGGPLDAGAALETGDGVVVTVTTASGGVALAHAPRKATAGSVVATADGTAFRVESVD